MCWLEKTMGGKPTVTAAVQRGFLSCWGDDSSHLEASFPCWQQLSAGWFQVRGVVYLLDLERKRCWIVGCHWGQWCYNYGTLPFLLCGMCEVPWCGKLDLSLCTLLIATNHNFYKCKSVWTMHRLSFYSVWRSCHSWEWEYITFINIHTYKIRIYVSIHYFLMQKECYPSPGHHLSVSCQVCDASLSQDDSFLIVIHPVPPRCCVYNCSLYLLSPQKGTGGRLRRRCRKVGR